MTGEPSEAPVRPDRKGIAGWMLFDWAAQPFFTVVTTFIFGPYFASRMVEDPDLGQWYWATIATISSFIIAVLSPVLGSIADASGARKRWIGAFALVKIVSLILLWWAAPGSSVFIVGLLFIMASIAAEFSIVFNDSMMTRLVDKQNVGRISNIAWGMGYLGGMIVLFAVLLLMAGNPETGKTLIGIDPIFGLDPAKGEDARITGPLSALWYLVFILPMFFFTPDTAKGLPLGQAVTTGIGALGDTVRDLRKRSGLLRFFIARMLYQDGVNGLLILGGAFAAGMFGWQTMELGLYGIILNVVAIFGCWAASSIDSRIGSKQVIFLSLISLILATIGIVSTTPDSTLFGLVNLPATDSGGPFGTAAEKAYILYGLLIGIAFGPIQASSRSYLARSVTDAEAGKYFGIYALSGRATSFLATGINSILIAATGSARIGMASLVLFLLAGFLLMWFTPYPADNREEAERRAKLAG